MITTKLRLPAMTLGTLVLSACAAETATTVATEEKATKNPYAVAFSSPPYLREHARYIEEELLRIGDTPVWDYNTPNRGFGNVIMIEGDDGIIIVDTRHRGEERISGYY